MKMSKTLKTVVASSAALFLAMGVGRFAFTPILPIMQSEYVFSDTTAGFFASYNYFGYLLGAIGTRFLPSRLNKFEFFRANIILCVLLTLFMGMTQSYEIWYLLRFVAGISSAVILVLGSAFAIENFKSEGKLNLTGMTYSGIGAGILFTGLAVSIVSKTLSSANIWILLAFLSLLPAALSFFLMPKIPHIKPTANAPKPEEDKNTFQVYRLYFSYFCEGLGYIVTATFIVSYMQRLTGSYVIAGNSWTIVGASAAVATMIWPHAAQKFGIIKSLIAAFLIQAVAIVIPVFIPNLFGAMLGAIGFGSTILGIVNLTLLFGQKIKPKSPHKVTATLTALFGFGQIIGPPIAGHFSDKTGSFNVALFGAASIVLLGGIVLLKDAAIED